MSDVSRKTNTVLLTLGLGFVFLPFFILGIFNHPCVDDFAYTNKTLLLGFWPAQIRWYTTWGGRYFSTALLSVDPLVIRSFLIYKLVPLALFLGLFHSLFMSIKEMTRPYFDSTRAAFMALVLLALYLDRMPGVSQGFYWYTGAVTYQVADILTLYLLTYIIRIQRIRQTAPKMACMALCFILIAATIGCNEISLIILVSLLLSVLAGSLYIQRKVNWALFLFVIVALIAAFYALTAPGNTVRMAHDFAHKQDLLLTIKSSIEEPFKSVFHWGIVLPMAALTIFAVPFAAEIAQKRIKDTGNAFIHPLYSLIGYIGLLTAAFLPGYWSFAGIPPERGLDVIYLLFILGWFFNVYIIVEHGIRKKGWQIAALPGYLTLILCCFIFLNFFKEDSNVRVAYADLLTGKAARYDRELENRYTLFAQTNQDVYELKALVKPPQTIYFDDITTNAKDWRNKSYAVYFHKKTIIIKRTDNSKDPVSVPMS